MARNPYTGFEPRAYWSRAFKDGLKGLYRGPPNLLTRDDQIMSAGSCFAANIVPYLEREGFHYIRTERMPSNFRVQPENLGYANFSAAYGNIYTARQMRQILDRANGVFEPAESTWRSGAFFVDSFRPGLRYRARSQAELRALTRAHLGRVVEAIRAASVFIFTFGLTETWESAQDGAIFPACPGTVAGTFDGDLHRFRNLTVGETVDDFLAFITGCRKINPTLRFVLTVSPVPLVATATGRHVLEATIYSKSVLRVAAEEIVARADGVTYFPSYEIVTGPQAPFEFFEDNRRDVSRTAIDTVMDCLFAACDREGATEGGEPAVDPAERRSAILRDFSKAMVTAECEEAMQDIGYQEQAGL